MAVAESFDMRADSNGTWLLAVTVSDSAGLRIEPQAQSLRHIKIGAFGRFRTAAPTISVGHEFVNGAPYVIRVLPQ